MDMHTEVKNLDAWIARFKNGPKIALEETANAGKRAGFAVERKAKGRVRVWRGHLRRSITTKTTTTALISTTKVGTNLINARAEEFGRPAGAPMPPPGSLLPWMAAKGIPVSERDSGFTEEGARAGTRRLISGNRRTRNDKGEETGFSTRTKRANGYYPVEYLIARAIKRKAPDPHPFLLNSFKELQPQIRKEFEKARVNLIARLKGGG